MNKEIKKISADNVCDKTIISNKIEQAKNFNSCFTRLCRCNKFIR